MRHLDTAAQRIPPFQMQWHQQQLVLSHNGYGWAVEISNGGTDVREKLCRVSPDQPEQGTETLERDLPERARGGRKLSRRHWHEECEVTTRL
jgi:hypothetical protein